MKKFHETCLEDPHDLQFCEETFCVFKFSCPNCDEKLMGYFKDRDVGKGDIFTEIMRESYVFEIIEKRCDKCDWYNTESDWAPKKIMTSIDINEYSR